MPFFCFIYKEKGGVILALFKIFKGTRSQFTTSTKVAKANEGYAYFTVDDGKFYIDTSGDGTTDAVLTGENRNRIPLSAEKADQDNLGNALTSTYISGGSISNHAMGLKSPNDTIIYNVPTMTGATSSVAGEIGLVPYPSAGDENKVLRGDGTWWALPIYNGQLANTMDLYDGTVQQV